MADKIIMDEYMVRIGTARHQRALSSYDNFLRIPYRVAKDDGKTILCGSEPWPDSITCPDCYKAIIQWAEACFTPGHRICPFCGSHWSLNSPNEETDQWFLRRARFY